MIRLTRTGFRRWLKKNEGKSVGRSKSFTQCPMCKYLESKGAKTVFMDVSFRHVDGKTYQNRRWQRQFQNHAMVYQDIHNLEFLRGGEAIYILDSV